MSAEEYWIASQEVLKRIRETQWDSVHEAAGVMAESIRRGRWVYVFGSGHSVIPVMDVFPRYGSFLGLRPLMDPRLMWCNVVAPGGAPELLWLERQEGYIANFLDSFEFTSADTLLVYSHGGLNAAPIEAALYARERGSKVVAVTSLENSRQAKPNHSSGLKLADAADLAIDNCVPPADALVDIGRRERVGAGSTLSVSLISMALVSETARILNQQGFELETFVSPNVAGVPADHNQRIFAEYRRRTSARS